MTVDLSTARVGSEVTTHAGAKLVIERCEPNEWGIKFWFSGYTGWFIYQPDGTASNAPRPNPMDIIAISPPPMSDAERLAEIVKICRREKERAIGAGVQCLVVEILDVAEGKRT